MRKTLDFYETCMRIKAVCRKKGMTVGRLAEEMNLSKQTVYAWFSAKKLPSIDHLIELADLLEVSVDELLVTRVFDFGLKEAV